MDWTVRIDARGKEPDKKMTADVLEWVRKAIAEDPLRAHRFYKSKRLWVPKRAEVLKLDRYECQKCRLVYHRYKKATTVHHIRHLKDRPDLALSVWVDDGDGRIRRQLVSLCDACHNEEHPEKLKTYEEQEPLTAERWD